MNNSAKKNVKALKDIGMPEIVDEVDQSRSDNHLD